jgi:hypothetical protein
MVCHARGLSPEEQNTKCEPPTHSYHGSYDVLHMSYFNRLLSHRRYQKSLASVGDSRKRSMGLPFTTNRLWGETQIAYSRDGGYNDK